MCRSLKLVYHFLIPPWQQSLTYTDTHLIETVISIIDHVYNYLTLYQHLSGSFG